MAKIKKESSEFDFETGIEELELILEKISDEHTSLEDSINLYAKAAELISECNVSLKNSEIKIEEITQKMHTAED